MPQRRSPLLPHVLMGEKGSGVEGALSGWEHQHWRDVPPRPEASYHANRSISLRFAFTLHVKYCDSKDEPHHSGRVLKAR